MKTEMIDQKPLKNFLALDLELNQPSGRIIQVGVCVGNCAQPESEYTVRKWHIDPGEPIAAHIVDLTGINDRTISHEAVTHAHAASEIASLIKTQDCFANPVTWGGGDSAELLSEFHARKVDFPHFGRRWIDVKTIHSFLMLAKGKNTTGGLRSAMSAHKLKFLGEPHRADVDAFNTLRFFMFLLRRQQRMDAMVTQAMSLG